MTSERYQQIEELYHEALEREPGERAAFLERACGEDVALRSEVESLLGYDEGAAQFIERPPDDVAAAMLAAEQTQSMLGRTLGHYHIVSLLGRGGMGEVYLAEDVRLKRKVALKLLPAHFTANRDRVRRFELEALAGSSRRRSPLQRSTTRTSSPFTRSARSGAHITSRPSSLTATRCASK